MGRLSTRDAALVADLSKVIGTLREGDPPILSTVLPAITDLLELARSAAYGVRVMEQGFDAEFVFWAGGWDSFTRVSEQWTRWVRSTDRRWGLYDPSRPEPAQRNVPVAMGPVSEVSRSGDARLRLERLLLRVGIEDTAEREAMVHRHVEVGASIFRQLRIEDQHQLRAVICDGDRMLAWVGGFLPDPPEARQKQLLSRLVEPLRKRLTLDAQLGQSALNGALFEAALEHLGVAAFVVTPAGQVAHANASGRALLDRNRPSTLEAMRASLAGDGASTWTCTPIAVGASSSSRTWRLVTAKPERPDVLARAEAAQSRWGLTGRQREVLVLLAQGRTNKAIGAELGCAESTVELHVTHLLQRADADTRAALVAQFWTAL